MKGRVVATLNLVKEAEEVWYDNDYSSITMIYFYETFSTLTQNI
jgi:hypothetical protein